MKTEILIDGENDKNLFGVKIYNSTKTGFYSLSHLQIAYDNIKVSKGWCQRRFQDIIMNEEIWERIYYIICENYSEKVKLLKSNLTFNKEKDDLLTFKSICKKDSVVKLLKELGLYETKTIDKQRMTLCDPYIWLCVCLEMNPEIYAKVIKWVGDGLITQRIEAGDLCVNLNDAIYKKFGKDKTHYIIQTAIGINKIVFGEHYKNIRNSKDKNELKELTKIEEYLANLINDDFIKSWEDITKWLTKQDKREFELK